MPILKLPIYRAWRAKLAKRVSVGLDIGSSAVRAAEVTIDGGSGSVSRFAQVGLPVGAVVEGEVRDEAAVVAAIKKLWSEGGFAKKEVVVGISSQRSMVRQVEMPKMGSSELRSALRYEMGDLLPIPVEQAVFDFVELGPGKPKADGGETTQVLLVVAQQEIVMDYIRVVKRSGLKVKAVDSSPLALLRAIPPGGDGLEVVVSLGAQLVVVAVRQGATPRFLRTVTSGDQSFAGARQQTVSGAATTSASTRPNGTSSSAYKLDPTVEEVRGSIEYFLAYAQGAQLEGMALTGGAAQAPGVSERFARVLGMPVRIADIGLEYDAASLDLDVAQVKQASFRWGAAVGLALWGSGDQPALSLIPAEVRERQKYQQALTASGAGLLALAVVLGGVSLARDHAASNVAHQVRAENAEAASLQSTITKIQPSAAIHGQLLTRRGLAVQALSGDVDFVGLLHRIEGALPPGVSIISVSVARSIAPPSGTVVSSGAAGASTTSQTEDIGQINMSLTTTGGPPSVAQFVRKMWDVPGLFGLWVSGASSAQAGGGGTAFSATANITSKALSNRAAQLPGADLLPRAVQP
jgi:type IV pilus assembly protein PilM